MRVLKHLPARKFLAGSLQSDFLAYLGVSFDASRRGMDSILSYLDDVYLEFLNHATDSVLSDAFRAFQSLRHSGNETEEMFARRVREQARLMVGAFDEPQIIAQFFDGVEPNARYCCRNGSTRSRTCLIKR